ncbi:MAG: hypothetical protein WC391_05385 [Methanoregula sp.]|jgi:uncharacterized membrane protein
MEDTHESRAIAEAVRALLFFLAGIIVIPFALGFVFNVPAHVTLGFIAAILVFQPFAAAVGAGLSLPPVFIIATLVSVAFSVIFGIFEICDGFAKRSTRLSHFIAKVKGIADRSVFFKKFGMYMLIPFILVPGVGLYGCAILDWLFYGKTVRGVLVIMIGWTLISSIILVSSLEILQMVA